MITVILIHELSEEHKILHYVGTCLIQIKIPLIQSDSVL